jgi:hypothetical protein
MSRSRVPQSVVYGKTPYCFGNGVQLVRNLSRIYNISQLAKHPLFLSFPILLWPAVWNGYPIVFADTGTYLAQAIHRYAGWDRPVFYSMFILPLHATVTLWPVVVVQAVLAAWILWLVCQALLPHFSRAAFVGGTALLAVATWLPWMVSELMPDVFTPLLILVVCLLTWAPERLSPRERVGLAGLAAFMIASQQSSLLLVCALLAVLGLLHHRRGAPSSASHHRRTLHHAIGQAPGDHDNGAVGRGGRAEDLRHRTRWVLIILPPALALLALCSINFAAHGRFAVSPFGNIFLLARVIYDGPGMAVLRRDCPTAAWRLCPLLGVFPPTSDEFLWQQDSPLNQAGGPKAVSQDADSIIRAALIADPAGEARAAVSNTLEQLGRFASGDGLSPWPAQVTAEIIRDFPAREAASYASARQQAGALSVPPVLVHLHAAVAVTGVVACLLLLPVAFVRRAPCTGFLVAVLITLPISAAITGALSTPHDRYQSRITWLPPFVAVISLASLCRRTADTFDRQ